MDGPYFNPPEDNRFYIVTYSQATTDRDNQIVGVLNHDIKLNFTDELDTYLGIDKDLDHYFVTNDTYPLFHSDVEIIEEYTTLTRAEFSTTDQALETEPDSHETFIFNITILPLIKNKSEDVLTSYTK